MTKEEYNIAYSQYQVLNNCLASSYRLKEQASQLVIQDKNDLQAQTMLLNAEHDINQLKGPVSSIWAEMLKSLEKEFNFKRLKNPMYSIKEESKLKIEK